MAIDPSTANTWSDAAIQWWNAVNDGQSYDAGASNVAQYGVWGQDTSQLIAANQAANPAPAPSPTRTSQPVQASARRSTQPAPAPAPAPTYTPPPVDKLDLQKVGWNKAVLTTYPELAALFRKGVAEGWSQETFQAKVRNTKWYKTHAESWRTTEILRLTDRKTYNQNLANTKANVVAQAAQMGATLSGDQLNSVVNQVFRLGVEGAQLTKLLSNYVVAVDGAMKGQAGATQEELKRLARANGISYNDNWYASASRAVVGGVKTLQDYENDIRRQAASAFPVYADQIKAGQDVADIASPYIQRMSALLEINPADVDLFDNSIREALSGRNPDTGKAQAKSLWQFENDLRKDPRWQKTSNAKETYSNLAQGVLKNWGLI